VEHREVQKQGQDLGARGEGVGGHTETELLRHLQRDAAEDIDDERGRGRGRGGQELAEVRFGEADELQREGLMVLGLDGREVLQLGQAVEGDGRVGGKEPARKGPVEPVSKGGSTTTIVTDSPRASKSLPSSIMETRWPIPGDGYSTTVVVAVAAAPISLPPTDQSCVG
jgi:hypothetical protein